MRIRRLRTTLVRAFDQVVPQAATQSSAVVRQGAHERASSRSNAAGLDAITLAETARDESARPGHARSAGPTRRAKPRTTHASTFTTF
jgi:hypothetical protein